LIRDNTLTLWDWWFWRSISIAWMARWTY